MILHFEFGLSFPTSMGTTPLTVIGSKASPSGLPLVTTLRRPPQTRLEVGGPGMTFCHLFLEHGNSKKEDCKHSIREKRE